jgi:dTDP-4-dehydrorhamnose reductase
MPRTSTASRSSSVSCHELNSSHGLVDWFLSTRGQVKGYAKAVFSGLPTIELARLILDVLLPRPELAGLYHVGAKPITKLDLLTLVAETYGKTVDIIPDTALVVDRSLNCDRFARATGYTAPEWPDLIALMHRYQPVTKSAC